MTNLQNTHLVDIDFDFPKNVPFYISVMINNDIDDMEYLNKFFTPDIGKLERITFNVKNEINPSRFELYRFILNENFEYFNHIICGSQKKILIVFKNKNKDHDFIDFLTPEVWRYTGVAII